MMSWVEPSGLAEDVMYASGEGSDRAGCCVGYVVTDDIAAGSIFWLVMCIIAFAAVRSVDKGELLGMVMCD